MKKVFLAIALTIGLGVNAQNIKFGAKAGLNIANLSNAEFSKNTSSRIAYHVGAMAEIKLNNQFAIQPELLYSAQGLSSEVKVGTPQSGVEGTSTVKLNYINIPVMAKYFVMDGLSLEVGPQLGFLTSAKVATDVEVKVNGKTVEIPEQYRKEFEKEYGEKDIKDETNSIDFGLNFGASYTYNNIYAGLRYNLGLTDLVKDNEGEDAIKNGVFQLSVGYFF